MSPKRYAALAAALLASLLATGAAAEPTRVLTPSVVRSEGGSILTYNTPIVILVEPEWDELNLKVIEMQNDVTRLDAENKVLREEVGARWPMWIMVSAALAGGIFVGTQL